MSDITLPCGCLLCGEKNTYRIEKVLGQGSYGITYLGVTTMQVHGSLGYIKTDVHVAIKEFFIREVNGRSLTTVTANVQADKYENYKRKFKREATNLSDLSRAYHHPNIINVLEYFESNNTVYYVMEYLEGGNLNDYLHVHGPQSEDNCLRMALQIGSALSYMHSRKMLHLDLKPGNIMLRSDGQIVLIDFGLSKQFDNDGNPETSINIGLGTSGYAPLEQANYYEGSQVVFPVTMDIYAMGGTLFKILTGKCPPKAEEILNRGFPVHELKERNVSDGFIRCIVKAMAPKKTDRYQNVESFMNELSLCMRRSSNVNAKVEAVEEVEVLSVDSMKEFHPAYEMKGKDDAASFKKNIEHKSKMILSKESQVKDNIFSRFSMMDIVKDKHYRKYGIVCSCLILLILIFSFWPGRNVSVNLTATGTTDGHRFVDLGLSVVWATCNVGAVSSEDFGNYFAWGETRKKEAYTVQNSKTCLLSIGNIAGSRRYDAASFNWGGGWRLPTDEEFRELKYNCTFTWMTYKGIKGCLLTSKINGNSIFLPAAGNWNNSSKSFVDEVGYYWSSTPSKSHLNNEAYNLRFDSEICSLGMSSRCKGKCIRPVHK